MPVIHCPTCHNPLTVGDDMVGRVVSCPTCRHPVGVPSADPLAELRPEPAGRRRAAGSGGGGKAFAIVFAVLVGVGVLAAVGVFLFGRGTESEDVRRLNELKDKSIDLKIELFDLQKKIDARDKRDLPPDVALAISHGRYMNDPEYLRVYGQLFDVVVEHNRILRRHPDWNRQPLSESLAR